MHKIVGMLLLSTLVPSPASAALPDCSSGVYSSLATSAETGDTGGMRITLPTDGSDGDAILQCAGSVLDKPVKVQVDMDGAAGTLVFAAHDDPDNECPMEAFTAKSGKHGLRVDYPSGYDPGLLLCAAALPAMADEPVTHVFRDWQASCSSIASACAAWVGDDTGAASLVVRRANVEQVGWELGLHLPGLADARTLVARVGDLQASLQRGRDWHEGDVAGDVVLVDAEADNTDPNASKLFAAMAKADVLRLAIGAPGPGTEHRFSLRGLKASLLWMDESQGKHDAWPLVQAPASLPGVSPELRKLQRHYSDDATLARIDTLPPAVRELRAHAGDCEPLVEATDGRGYQVQWLDANTALFSMACTLTPREPLDLQVVAHAPDFSDARSITFPTWDESQPPLSQPLAVPRTEAVSTLPMPGLLPVFSRLRLRQQDNRGGLEQTWRWDGRGMQLIEVRRMTLHDQVEGPWQVLWQALAVRR